MTLSGVTLPAGATLTNKGLLIFNQLFQGGVTLNGQFANASGATLRLDHDGNSYPLTLNADLVNRGTIELTDSAGSSNNTTVQVTNGTLTNATGGVIRPLPSSAASPGLRKVNLGKGATLTNSSGATIQVNSADLTVTQTDRTFVNAGRVSVSGGRTFTYSGVAFENTGILDSFGTTSLSSQLTVDGNGILAVGPAGRLQISGNLTGNTQNADAFAPQGIVQFTGPMSGVQLLEVMGKDLGNVGAGFSKNFAWATLTLSNDVRLVDNARNVPGTASQYR